MLLVTGVSLLGIIAAIVVATALMFVGGLFALMIKLLPWLLLAVAVVWVIRALKSPNGNAFATITVGVTKVLRVRHNLNNFADNRVGIAAQICHY